ncbi:hypothetical protein ABIB66_008691 [Bradyrhizobium sp. F1.13.3]
MLMLPSCLGNTLSLREHPPFEAHSRTPHGSYLHFEPSTPSLRKMLTTSVRRLISPPTRSIGLVVGDLPPFGAGGLRIVLGERDRGRNGAPTLLPGRVANEVDAAPLPAGIEHLGDRGLDTFVGIGHDRA